MPRRTVSVAGGLALGIAAMGLMLLSGAPYSRAGTSRRPKTLAEPPVSGEAAQRLEPTHVVSTFDIYSVNTLESVTVRYVDGRVDPESKKQLDHLLRCLRTGHEKPIDPRLIDDLRAVAHEVDRPLALVSGYRAPKHRWSHNYHNRGQAADIRVDGMVAYQLRNVARKLKIPGIGHYPTTNMIHIDVRDVPYQWIDWSGPNVVWHKHKKANRPAAKP